MSGRLNGKIALVTGAARGIGAAIARKLTTEGAQVLVTDINPDVEAVAKDIGGETAFMTQDVTSEAAWAAAIALAQERFGGLDILVNNAGMHFAKPLLETSLEDMKRMFAVNVESVMLGTKIATPLLAERAAQWEGGASVINISSVAGLGGAPLNTAYCASKGAVRIFTKAAALELVELKIRVNSVHPGVIETPMAESLLQGPVDAGLMSGNESREMFTTAHPMGHFGRPKDIADGVCFLASDESAFMTGSELVVDGGVTAS